MNELFREVVQTLHKQALEDREFGIKLALAISDSKVYSISENNLRLLMLQSIQKDYEGKNINKKIRFYFNYFM